MIKILNFKSERQLLACNSGNANACTGEAGKKQI